MNSQEQKRLLMDLDINMRTVDCFYTVTFYGALFREVRPCWVGGRWGLGCRLGAQAAPRLRSAHLRPVQLPRRPLLLTGPPADAGSAPLCVPGARHRGHKTARAGFGRAHRTQAARLSCFLPRFPPLCNEASHRIHLTRSCEAKDDVTQGLVLSLPLGSRACFPGIQAGGVGFRAGAAKEVGEGPVLGLWAGLVVG